VWWYWQLSGYPARRGNLEQITIIWTGRFAPWEPGQTFPKFAEVDSDDDEVIPPPPQNPPTPIPTPTPPHR